MPLKEEIFDQQKIDSLKRILQREADKGRPRDYEILIDGFKIVSRTDDVSEFDEYEQEVRETTRNISILIYDGQNTNRNTRYSFALQGDSNTRNNISLNGLGEVDQIIAQKMEEKEREYELNRLREKLTATQSQLTEAEEFADTLQTRIKEMEDKRYTNAVSIGEVASVVLKGLVQQHASKLPGGQALAGLLGADTHPAVTPPSLPEATVSFERSQEGNLDEQTKSRLSLIAQMQERFNEQQMIAVFTIMDDLAASPEKIHSVLVHLGHQANFANAA